METKGKGILTLKEVDPLLKEVYDKPKSTDNYKSKKKFSKIRNAINRKKKPSISK